MGAMNLARTNSLKVDISDYMLCLLYGEDHQKNTNIKKIEENYTVVIGKEFWHRLTGDESFYTDLIKTINETANEYNKKKEIEDIITKLAEDTEKKHPNLSE